MIGSNGDSRFAGCRRWLCAAFFQANVPLQSRLPGQRGDEGVGGYGEGGTGWQLVDLVGGEKRPFASSNLR